MRGDFPVGVRFVRIDKALFWFPPDPAAGKVACALETGPNFPDVDAASASFIIRIAKPHLG